MLDVNNADDDSVWCYNDEYHCFFITRKLIATYYSLIYTGSQTILHKGNNLSFRKIGAVWARMFRKKTFLKWCIANLRCILECLLK